MQPFTRSYWTTPWYPSSQMGYVTLVPIRAGPKNPQSDIAWIRIRLRKTTLMDLQLKMKTQFVIMNHQKQTLINYPSKKVFQSSYWKKKPNTVQTIESVPFTRWHNSSIQQSKIKRRVKEYHVFKEKFKPKSRRTIKYPFANVKW